MLQCVLQKTTLRQKQAQWGEQSLLIRALCLCLSVITHHIVFSSCSNHALNGLRTCLLETGDCSLPLLLQQWWDVMQIPPRCWQDIPNPAHFFYFSIDRDTEYSNYHRNRTCQLQVSKSCSCCCAVTHSTFLQFERNWTPQSLHFHLYLLPVSCMVFLVLTQTAVI